MPKERWLPPIRCMHEWPLVLFTALAVPGAGVYAVRLLAPLAGNSTRTPEYLLAVALGLLAAGAGLSLLHLGRPTRAVLALCRVGRNPLSAEIALVAALLAAGTLLLVPGLSPSTVAAVDAASGACAVALLAAFGAVYYLRTRWPWRTVLAFAPLVSGMSAGAVILCTAPGARTLLPFALLALAADAALGTRGWRPPRQRGWLPAHPTISEYRRRLLTLRLVFANLLPAGLLAAGLAPGAAIAVGVGVLIDRFSFYGLAMVQTTEASVADVERTIAACV
jgi:DMSO reductase anchor subunit